MMTAVKMVTALGGKAVREGAQGSSRLRATRHSAWPVAVALLAVVLLAGLASAEIPQKINYQGRLVDGVTGDPLAGSHDVVFKLYDVVAGGDTLWTESQTVYADSAGVFSCLLGTHKPITASFDGQSWLQVEVDGEILQPRRELVSVPYAFVAQDALDAVHATHASGADSLDGQSADAFAPAIHSHDDRYYTETELNASGTINQTGNPVDWTKLKSVPAGFADGTDDVGVGDGYSLDAADGDPVDAVYVNNAGNVGIGTTNPTLGKLQVENPPGTGVYAASNDGTGILGFSQSGTGVLGVSNNGYAGSFVGDVYVSGNLGVGVDDPAEKVDIDGNLRLSGHLSISDAPVLVATGNPEQLKVGRYAGRVSTGLSNTFVGNISGYLNTAGYRNTFLGDHAGQSNIGGGNNTFLGTNAGMSNSSGDMNTYVGEMAGMLNDTGSYNTCLGSRAGSMAPSGNENTFIGWGAGDVNEGSRNIFLGYAAGYTETGSDKLYIANGEYASNVLIYGDFATGRIGLGTLAPERKLHIKGEGPRVLIEASAGNPEVNFKTAGDAAGEIWAIYKHSVDEDLRFYQNGDRLTIRNSTGNVGIGTTNPGSYKLYVNGEAYTTGSWNGSDLRLKKDLQPIGDALSKVLQLKGLSFLWRTEEYPERGLPEGRHYGLIAQDVEQVLPEVVKEGSDGEKAVAYSELIAVLVESIKQLKAETDQLRAENAALRTRLDALKVR